MPKQEACCTSAIVYRHKDLSSLRALWVKAKGLFFLRNTNVEELLNPGLWIVQSMTGLCFMTYNIFCYIPTILLWQNGWLQIFQLLNCGYTPLNKKSVQIIILCCPYVLICIQDFKMAYVWSLGLKFFFFSVIAMHICSWQGHRGINMQWFFGKR